MRHEVILALLLAACGDSNVTTARFDLSALPDMTVARDFARPSVACTDGAPGGCTGDPCTSAQDCAKGRGASQQAQCLKSVNGIIFEGGSCTSACRPSTNDEMNNFINPDCPGGSAVCAGNGSSGQCVAICTGVVDCRDQYVCAFATGTPSAGCMPIGASTCDPDMDPRPQGKRCAMGQRCTSYSPDNSYGQCADICDPIAQNCAPPMMGTNGCVVDLKSDDGSGECINVSDNLESNPCFYLNDCAAGMMCYGGKCRQYCRSDGPACPDGQTCGNIQIAGLVIKFDVTQTGICSP